MPRLIDGRAVAQKVYAELREEIANLKSRGSIPGLAVILIGDDAASRTYVRAKDKMCRELGLHSVKLELPATTTQEELLARVDEHRQFADRLPVHPHAHRDHLSARHIHVPPRRVRPARAWPRFQ